jgi:hypothetical protein
MQIVKMTLGKPGGGGARERENAMMTDHNGQIICFWELNEPEILRAFEGRDYAYFYAEVEDDVHILGQAPDQSW